MSKGNFEKLQRINWLTSEMDGLYHSMSLKIGLSDSASRILYALYTGGDCCLLSEIYKESGISKQFVFVIYLYSICFRRYFSGCKLYIYAQYCFTSRCRRSAFGKLCCIRTNNSMCSSVLHITAFISIFFCSCRKTAPRTDSYGLCRCYQYGFRRFACYVASAGI